MSASKHTPGPWEIGFCGWLNDEAGNDAASISGEGWGDFAKVCVRLDGEQFQHPEGIANARLIAAAPALLSALSALVDEFGSTIEQYHKVGPHWTQRDGNETFDVGVVLDREPLIKAARDIIAKAKATPSDTHEVG